MCASLGAYGATTSALLLLVLLLDLIQKFGEVALNLVRAVPVRVLRVEQGSTRFVVLVILVRLSITEVRTADGTPF